MASKQHRKNGTKKTRRLVLFVGWFFGVIGLLSFMMLVFSFTDVPYNAYYRLGATKIKLSRPPDLIVILSGNSMPSPDGFIRAYYGTQAARQYPDAKVILSLPKDQDGSLRPLKLMADELIIKGIDSSRILFEPMGFNTRSQALNVAALWPGKSNPSVLLITAPEHMYRSIKTFQKAGFPEVGGWATFDQPIDPKSAINQEKTTDIQVKNLSLRYNMWSYLQYELLVLREYTAIAYYKIKGWI